MNNQPEPNRRAAARKPGRRRVPIVGATLVIVLGVAASGLRHRVAAGRRSTDPGPDVGCAARSRPAGRHPDRPGVGV